MAREGGDVWSKGRAERNGRGQRAWLRKMMHRMKLKKGERR